MTSTPQYTGTLYNSSFIVQEQHLKTCDKGLEYLGVSRWLGMKSDLFDMCYVYRNMQTHEMLATANSYPYIANSDGKSSHEFIHLLT